MELAPKEKLFLEVLTSKMYEFRREGDMKKEKSKELEDEIRHLRKIVICGCKGHIFGISAYHNGWYYFKCILCGITYERDNGKLTKHEIALVSVMRNKEINDT